MSELQLWLTDCLSVETSPGSLHGAHRGLAATTGKSRSEETAPESDSSLGATRGRHASWHRASARGAFPATIGELRSEETAPESDSSLGATRGRHASWQQASAWRAFPATIGELRSEETAPESDSSLSATVTRSRSEETLPSSEELPSIKLSFRPGVGAQRVAHAKKCTRWTIYLTSRPLRAPVAQAQAPVTAALALSKKRHFGLPEPRTLTSACHSFWGTRGLEGVF